MSACMRRLCSAAQSPAPAALGDAFGALAARATRDFSFNVFRADGCSFTSLISHPLREIHLAHCNWNSAAIERREDDGS
jgi:hypothetical protein